MRTAVGVVGLKCGYSGPLSVFVGVGACGDGGPSVGGREFSVLFAAPLLGVSPVSLWFLAFRSKRWVAPVV